MSKSVVDNALFILPLIITECVRAVLPNYGQSSEMS